MVSGDVAPDVHRRLTPAFRVGAYRGENTCRKTAQRILISAGRRPAPLPVTARQGWERVRDG